MFNNNLHVFPNPVDNALIDWMHSPVPSGGVGQFVINQFVLRMKQNNFNPQMVDAYAGAVTWPKSAQRLPKEFFQTRVQASDKAHIKGFGAETLTAITILVFFSEMCLGAQHVVRPHAQCVTFLYWILRILQQRSDAGMHAGQLRRMVDLFVDQYRSLYGAIVGGKPKLHFLLHIPDQICKFNFDCFATEASNKSVNQHGRSSVGPQLGNIILHRLLGELLHTIDLDNFAMPIFLPKLIFASSLEDYMATEGYIYICKRICIYT